MANNRLMGATQLALTWVGWPNGEKLALILTKVSANCRKSTQVHARPGQTKSKSTQVFNFRLLAPPFGLGFNYVNNCMLGCVFFAESVLRVIKYVFFIYENV